VIAGANSEQGHKPAAALLCWWHVTIFLPLKPLLIAEELAQDALGRLADVHAIEEAQADQDAWAALSKECDPVSSFWRIACGELEQRHGEEWCYGARQNLLQPCRVLLQHNFA